MAHDDNHVVEVQERLWNALERRVVDDASSNQVEDGPLLLHHPVGGVVHGHVVIHEHVQCRCVAMQDRFGVRQIELAYLLLD